jgi:hypothetical protein
MSKKDYNAIAAVIKKEYDSIPLDSGSPTNTSAALTIHSTALHLAELFAAGNPNFNVNYFMIACGVRS